MPNKARASRPKGLVMIAALVAGGWAVLLFAYTSFQDDVNNQPIPTRWANDQITWFLNPNGSTNVNTTGGVTVAAALGNAINVWAQTQFNSQTLNSLAITAGGNNTSASAPNISDCLNIVGFSDTTPGDFPSGTIAFTQVATVTNNGATNFPLGPPTCPSGSPVASQICPTESCLIDGDMEFNPADTFSTATPTPTNDFDLQSVASHEFGHMLGMDHSGIAHAMMFPFGDVGQGQQRALATDDVMGIAFLYPSSIFSTATGSVSGTVTLGGTGAFAAHVVIVDAITGNVVVDGLTNPDGTYTIQGVPQGTYNVLVLPLAANTNSGIYTISDFSGWVCGYTTSTACTGFPTNPTNYTGRFF